MKEEKTRPKGNFSCPYGIYVETIEECIGNYVDATSFQQKGNRCYKCPYGKETRKMFAEGSDEDVYTMTTVKEKPQKETPPNSKKPRKKLVKDPDKNVSTPVKVKSKPPKEIPPPSPLPILEGISNYRIFHILSLRIHATGKRSFTTRGTVLTMAGWIGFKRSEKSSKRRNIEKVFSKIIKANLGEITNQDGKVTIKWLHDPNLLWPNEVIELKARLLHRR